MPGGSQELVGTLVGNVNIPIYDGGATFASIRQAKEQVSQQELTADSQRDKVRQAVVAAWFANQNAPGVVRAAKAQVQAAEVALAGVREEAKVGQRTTLDVLNAQQTLLQARVAARQRAARSGRLFLHAAVQYRPPFGRRCSAFRSPNTIRACISIRSRPSSSACARRTAADAEIALWRLRLRKPCATLSADRPANRRLSRRGAPRSAAAWRIR